MEQRQENMAGEFLGLSNSISAGDERARTFCKVLGSKLKNGSAYLLDLDNILAVITFAASSNQLR